jgi:hypothetical protein
MDGVKLILAPNPTKFPTDYLVYKFLDCVLKYATKIKIIWRYYSYNSLRYKSYDHVSFKLADNDIIISFGREVGSLHYQMPSLNGIISIIINGTNYILYDNELCIYDLSNDKYISHDEQVKELLNSIIDSFKKTELNTL